MSDVNELLIAPLEKFSKDSMHLIKKCTKPDRKGEYVLLRVWFLRLVHLTTDHAPRGRRFLREQH